MDALGSPDDQPRPGHLPSPQAEMRNLPDFGVVPVWEERDGIAEVVNIVVSEAQ